MPKLMTYRGIADDIALRIQGGEYEPEQKLPSYRELTQLYSVSMSTAQRAILVLQERGLVYGSPGRGVFVAEAPAGAIAA